MGEREFWVVWNPNGGNPTVRHDSEQSALQEAERLARTSYGEFYVLHATSRSKRVDVSTVRLGPDLPF